MKSEERHHLKENDLEKILTEVKPFIEKNTNLVIGVVVGLVVLLGAYMWVNRPPSVVGSKAASALLTARSQEDFANIASGSKYKGMAISDWARLKEADLLLQSGVNLLFSDRAGALSDLNKAFENYETIIASTTDLELQELASYGRACALEAKSEGDLTEAIQAFEAFMEKYKGSLLVADAKKRADRLKKEDVKALYSWMAKNAGKPEAEAKPLDGAVTNPLEKFSVPLENKEDAQETPEAEAAPEADKKTEEPAKEEAAAETKTEPAKEVAPAAKPAAEEAASEAKAEESAAEKEAESAKTE